MKTNFWMNIRFFNGKVFERKWYFLNEVIDIDKTKQNKTERKSKFWNELANYLTENILLNKYLLLHKHPAIGYNFNIFEWKNDNLMKLLHSFFI